MWEFFGWCDEFGVCVVLLYLLLSDNLCKWDLVEFVDFIEIIVEFVEVLLQEENWWVKYVGCLDIFFLEFVCVLVVVEECMKDYIGLYVNFVVGYGGCNEIVDVVCSIIMKYEVLGGIMEDFVVYFIFEMIGEYLYMGGQLDFDLVIWMSGEQ